MEAIKILQPVIAMGLLTIVIAFYMIITRVSAMKRLKVHPQKGQDTRELKLLLPHEVNKISNNYNHLFEQPTLFYVVALTIAVLGHVDFINVICAWSYVGLRIAHSLVQITVDRVMLRFSFFLLSWIALAVLVVKEAMVMLF